MKSKKLGKQMRGFAVMDAKMRKIIASMGGRAVSLDREHMAELGRLGGAAVLKKFGRKHLAAIGQTGGETVSEIPGHMAKLGRKGGRNVSVDHAHMVEIGRKGGLAGKGLKRPRAEKSRG